MVAVRSPSGIGTVALSLLKAEVTHWQPQPAEPQLRWLHSLLRLSLSGHWCTVASSQELASGTVHWQWSPEEYKLSFEPLGNCIY